MLAYTQLDSLKYVAKLITVDKPDSWCACSAGFLDNHMAKS
jgi:hypothetical protein